MRILISFLVGFFLAVLLYQQSEKFKNVSSSSCLEDLRRSALLVTSVPGPTIELPWGVVHKRGYVNLWNDDIDKYISLYGEAGVVRGLLDSRPYESIVNVNRKDSSYGEGFPFPGTNSVTSEKNIIRVCDIFYYTLESREGNHDVFEMGENIKSRDLMISEKIQIALRD